MSLRCHHEYFDLVAYNRSAGPHDARNYVLKRV